MNESLAPPQVSLENASRHPDRSNLIYPGRGNERIMFVANSLIASLQLSFVKPLEIFVEAGTLITDLITEQHITKLFGADKAGPAAARWIEQRLDAFHPSLIVLCRYSFLHGDVIVAWARRAGVPTLYHIDDDLLNIPIELGVAKFELHNHPDRLAAVRYMLAESTLVCCSTQALRDKLFGQDTSGRVLAGEVFVGHHLLAGPTKPTMTPVIGYMGTDHKHDFDLALPGLVKTMEHFPNVQFQMFGPTPIPESLGRFGDRVTVIGPVGDYAAFIAKLASLDWTIGICPLQQTPFNMCKANSKWVEYTACGFAVVASAHLAYERSCADGCGLLVSDEAGWADAFATLLTDDTARQAQVSRAQARLRERYSPEAQLRQLLNFFETAHALLDAGPRGTAIDEGGSGDSNHMHFDSVGGNVVNGWAWMPADKSKSSTDRVALEVWCGSTRLGFCKRRLSRPDVDAYVQDPLGDKGFQLPVACLDILWPLLGCNEGLHPKVRLHKQIWSLYEGQPALLNPAEFRTLRCVDGQAGFKIDDLWWATSRRLKFRIDLSAMPPALRLSVYQPSLSEGRMSLAQGDEVLLANPMNAVISLGILSPCMPLLLVGCDANGEILFTDLVPFPSLIRGGLHHAEVSALGVEGGTLADLRSLSDEYVAEAVAFGAEPAPFTVAEIGVDLTGATGAETIFDPTVVGWLAGGLGIELSCEHVEARLAADLGDEAFASHAARRLGLVPAERPRGGACRLSLSAGALPTLAALTSRRIRVASKAQVGSFIVVDDVTARRRWVVTCPHRLHTATPDPGGGMLVDAPMLTRIAGQTSEADTPWTAPVLAIAYRDLTPRTPAQMMFPIPKDHADIVPPPSATGCGRISALLLIPRHVENHEALIASIAQQVTSSGHELVVAAAGHTPWELDTLRATLERLMPGRTSIVSVTGDVGVSAAYNRAAETANGDILVLLDDAVVLHDRRTLETLARLAAAEGAGTVGCAVVSFEGTRSNTPAFRSAGYFPARIDFSVAPHLAVAEINCWDVLPGAVYPVVANSALCFAIAKEGWTTVGGFDERRFPGALAEIDLATRLAAVGRVNLCTTRISASNYGTSRARRLRDVQALAQLQFWHVADALRTSTVVRSF